VIRYSYNQQILPPAPFVFVRLVNPADGRALDNVPAQLDHGADRSVLPSNLVHDLGLAQMGIAEIGGLGGNLHELPTYIVLIGIHDLPPRACRVLSCTEPWVLLGRDILNDYRILLDGPQRTLEIG
jgi:hypothetical protein